jgi:uncharacterized protein YjbJ (UPF0337 family)
VGTDDKIRNKAQEWTGKGKEAVGDATGDDELRAEGRADQGESALKQAGEKVTDAASKVKDAVTRD